MKKLFFISLFSLLPLSLFAQTHDHHKDHKEDAHQSHKAHTHGEADLSLIFDAGQLAMELETPAENVLGFEHEPTNSAEWKKVKDIKATLKEPANLIKVPANCNLMHTDIAMPFKKAEHDHEHDHHKHDAHDEKANSHKDVYVMYQWDCGKITGLSVELSVFDSFPTFDKIHAQWIVNDKQGFKTLGKHQVKLDLK